MAQPVVPQVEGLQTREPSCFTRLLLLLLSLFAPLLVSVARLPPRGPDIELVELVRAEAKFSQERKFERVWRLLELVLTQHERDQRLGVAQQVAAQLGAEGVLRHVEVGERGQPCERLWGQARELVVRQVEPLKPRELKLLKLLKLRAGPMCDAVGGEAQRDEGGRERVQEARLNVGEAIHVAQQLDETHPSLAARLALFHGPQGFDAAQTLEGVVLHAEVLEPTRKQARGESQEVRAQPIHIRRQTSEAEEAVAEGGPRVAKR
mmetsp:Transcript_65017/g.146684  ORF Transcript_65017/g.146684 Transcript_65017/m.146684 type:complete len:264 (+) Transcript_65017:58-849(+)